MLLGTMLLPFSNVQAASENWRWRTGGPSGAPVRDVVVDPVRSGHLWAVTPSGIFETDDEGVHWRSISGGLTNPWGSCWVTCVATDAQGGRLMAGTRLSGLFASDDHGRSWAPLQPGFEMSVETISAISIDPRDSRKALVGTNAGLFMSDDNGASFRRASIPNTGDVPGTVLALERHPNDPDRVYVSIDRAGLYTSGDGGLTWTASGDGLIGAPACLAFDPGNQSPRWAAGSGGLHRWDSIMNRWVPIGSGIPRDADITSLCALSGSNGGLYAGTRRGRLFRSVDNGDTWERLSDAPPQPGPAILRPRPGGGVYMAGGGGLFLSTDGRTWTTIDTELSAAPIRSLTLLNDRFGHLIAATGIGMFRSEDFGDTWARVNSGLKSGQFAVNRVSSEPDRPSRLCAATGDGLVLSDDSGRTWRSTPLSGWVMDVLPLPQNPGSMLAPVLQSDETVLYATGDDGAVWQERLRAARDPAAWLSITTGGEIFFWAGGLYRSNDEGRSWEMVVLPAGVTNFTDIADVGLGTGWLIAGTDDGLYESNDRGMTWTWLALTGRRVAALEIHRLETGWMIALCDDGLHLSLDAGRTWADVPLDGVAGTPTGLAIDPSRDFLYLTDANAVYISAIPRPPRRDEPERMKAHPNPFAVATQITFDLKEPGSGEVTLFTVDGDRVRQFLFTTSRAGVHDVVWDGLNDHGERLPNGMYIVVVRTDRETYRGKLIKIG